MCHAREQLGALLPPGTPSLPSPPATPPGPAPTCLPCDSLAGRPAAGGRESGLAGRRAGGGRCATRPRTWRTDLGATPAREAREGRRGSRGRRGAGRGGGRSRRCLRSPCAAPRRDCAALRLTWACAPPGSRWLEAGCSSECPAFSAPPHPHGDCGRSCSPPTPSRACGRDPGGACPAPAQRPPSAHSAPSRLQCDPWRLGGPLAPKRLLTTHTMLQDTTGRPLKSKAILVTYAMQALGRALKA